MWNILFNCSACKNPFNLDSDLTGFPLCRACFRSLIPAPSLCSHCGGPNCQRPNCLRPWVTETGISSYSALYLLVGRGYSVLRSWKIHSGPLFDQIILKPNLALLVTWKKFDPEFILPIPQAYARSWKMRGSRAEKLAKWVGTQLKCPVESSLLLPKSPENPRSENKRQAQLSLEKRLSSPFRMKLNPAFTDHRYKLSKELARKSVILVDDFMTTGHTVRQAAQLLNRIGIREIHVFCLGVRIRASESNQT